MKRLKASDIKERGTRGTTLNAVGALGLGYKVDGIVYKAGGDGYYYECCGKTRIVDFRPDDGKGYLEKVKQLGII